LDGTASALLYVLGWGGSNVSGRHAVAFLALAALSACRKTDSAAGTAATRATPLSLLPADTRLVMSVDLARLRETPLVAKLAAANPLPAALVQLAGDFAAQSGVDPWRTFDSIVVAAGDSHEQWAVIARGQRLDGARLGAWARQALRDSGGELVAEKRGRWTFWSARGRPGMEAFLLDDRTLVVAAGRWAGEIASLAGASAASNADLARLCQGVSGHPVWAAAIVSEKLRDEWLDNLQMQEAAWLDRLAVTFDVDTGLDGKLTATMTDAERADRLAEELAQLLVRERLRSQSNPKLEALLKGVTTYVDGNAVQVDASLGEALLVSWTRWLSRYWLIVGARLPEPSRRAEPLRLVPGATSPRQGSIALGDARIFTDWENERYTIVEVANRTSRPLAPALQLLYRRKSGDLVGPGFCAVQVGVLLPGEKAVCTGRAPPGAVFASYDVHLLDGPETNEKRIALQVRGARLGPPLGPVQWVTGRVKNESRVMLEHPQVHVAFYDAAGKLVGYGREHFGDKPLLPGGEVPFQATSLVLMPGAATTFAVTAFAVGKKQ
jgi:hypothetical protein